MKYGYIFSLLLLVGCGSEGQESNASAASVTTAEFEDLGLLGDYQSTVFKIDEQSDCSDIDPMALNAINNDSLFQFKKTQNQVNLTVSQSFVITNLAMNNDRNGILVEGSTVGGGRQIRGHITEVDDGRQVKFHGLLLIDGTCRAFFSAPMLE